MQGSGPTINAIITVSVHNQSSRIRLVVNIRRQMSFNPTLNKACAQRQAVVKLICGRKVYINNFQLWFAHTASWFCGNVAVVLIFCGKSVRDINTGAQKPLIIHIILSHNARKRNKIIHFIGAVFAFSLWINLCTRKPELKTRTLNQSHTGRVVSKSWIIITHNTGAGKCAT